MSVIHTLTNLKKSEINTMKKLYLFTILSFLLASIAYGQVDCSELESKNEKLGLDLTKKEQIISNQTETISKQEKEIQYYKESLDLLSSKISTVNKDVTFKINSVVGDSNSGIVTIEGILINNGVLRSIQGQKAIAFDPKGNGLPTYKISVGNETRIEKLLKDVPTKFSLNLEQIVVGTPMLTALIIDFYSNVGYKSDALNVVFKNLDVTWN